MKQYINLLIASIKKIYRKPWLNIPEKFETSDFFFTKMAHRLETRGVLLNRADQSLFNQTRRV